MCYATHRPFYPSGSLISLMRNLSSSTVVAAKIYTHQNPLDTEASMEHISAQLFLTSSSSFTPTTSPRKVGQQILVVHPIPSEEQVPSEPVLLEQVLQVMPDAFEETALEKNPNRLRVEGIKLSHRTLLSKPIVIGPKYMASRYTKTRNCNVGRKLYAIGRLRDSRHWKRSRKFDFLLSYRLCGFFVFHCYCLRFISSSLLITGYQRYSPQAETDTMRCKSSVSNSMLMELSSHLARKGSIDKGL